MKKDIKKQNGMLVIDITIDGEQWKKATTKAKKKLISNVEVKGFRKGQAPVEMAEKMIDPLTIYKQALDNELDEIYKDVASDLTKENIISRPEISYTKASDNEGAIRIEVVLFPEIELPSLDVLKTKRDEVKVTDKDIETEYTNFQKQLRNSSEVKDANATAEMGDIVTIDFVGTIDGEAFSGGTANEYDLELGSKSFIDGFEEQVVGMKVGDSKDVKVTFPADYQVDEFQSKPAVFAVKLHAIKRHTELEGEELTARLNMFGFDSLEHLRAEAGKLLHKDRLKKANDKFRREVIQEIVDLEATKIPVPDYLIDQESEAMWKNLEQEIEKNKQTVKEVLKQIGKTKTEYINEHMKPEAKQRLQDSLIISEIAKVANIEIDENELNKLMEEQATEAKIPVEQFKEIVNPETIRINAIHDKVLDYVANKTK